MLNGQNTLERRYEKHEFLFSPITIFLKLFASFESIVHIFPEHTQKNN